MEGSGKHTVNQKFPVIFIHQGDSPYLKYSLNQAIKSNSNCNIVLLGDDENNRYPGIQHYQIQDYNAGAVEFEKIYKHLSTNAHGFELFCIQRWFILYQFLVEQKLDACVCLDTDVMLYCDLQEKLRIFQKFRFTLSHMSSPHILFLNDRAGLKELLEFIKIQYSVESNFQKYFKIYTEMDSQSLKGGICDMTFFNHFYLLNKNEIGDSHIKHTNGIFDHNINDPEQFQKSILGVKKVFFIKQKPYLKMKKTKERVLVNSLHCQGMAKADMQYFYYANKSYAYQYLFKSLFLWNRFFRYIKIRLSKLKNRIQSGI